jgi:DUF1365 family protein
VVGRQGRQPPGGQVAGVTARSSALFVGSVRHRRHRPREHAFRYRTYHALIDVDELPRLDREVTGFGYRRAAVTSFHDVDHFGPLDLPVREKLARWLADRGVALPDGPVRTLTNLRVFGHVFNPVSWWFCHAADGRLELIVAEVNNTFGDAHSYLLTDLDQRDGVVRARTSKVFHVSPFLPVEGLEYRFEFVLRDDRITVHMGVDDGDGRLLDATQDGCRRELESLLGTLVSHPLMTLWTVGAIHLQAIRLWTKRVRFHRRPEPPADGYPRAPEPGDMVVDKLGRCPVSRMDPAEDPDPGLRPRKLAS